MTDERIALRELLEKGSGCREIAASLNRRGVPSPRGHAWYPEQVRRTAKQLEALHAADS